MFDEFSSVLEFSAVEKSLNKGELSSNSNFGASFDSNFGIKTNKKNPKKILLKDEHKKWIIAMNK